MDASIDVGRVPARCAISSGHPSMRAFQMRRALSKCIAAPDQRSVQRLPEFWR
jgi:hypothetical protein